MMRVFYSVSHLFKIATLALFLCAFGESARGMEEAPPPPPPVVETPALQQARAQYVEVDGENLWWNLDTKTGLYYFYPVLKTKPKKQAGVIVGTYPEYSLADALAIGFNDSAGNIVVYSKFDAPASGLLFEALSQRLNTEGEPKNDPIMIITSSWMHKTEGPRLRPKTTKDLAEVAVSPEAWYVDSKVEKKQLTKTISFRELYPLLQGQNKLPIFTITLDGFEVQNVRPLPKTILQIKYKPYKVTETVAKKVCFWDGKVFDMTEFGDTPACLYTHLTDSTKIIGVLNNADQKFYSRQGSASDKKIELSRDDIDYTEIVSRDRPEAEEAEEEAKAAEATAAGTIYRFTPGKIYSFENVSDPIAWKSQGGIVAPSNERLFSTEKDDDREFIAFLNSVNERMHLSLANLITPKFLRTSFMDYMPDGDTPQPIVADIERFLADQGYSVGGGGGGLMDLGEGDADAQMQALLRGFKDQASEVLAAPMSLASLDSIQSFLDRTRTQMLIMNNPIVSALKEFSYYFKEAGKIFTKDNLAELRLQYKKDVWNRVRKESFKKYKNVDEDNRMLRGTFSLGADQDLMVFIQDTENGLEKRKKELDAERGGKATSAAKNIRGNAYRFIFAKTFEAVTSEEWELIKEFMPIASELEQELKKFYSKAFTAEVAQKITTLNSTLESRIDKLLIDPEFKGYTYQENRLSLLVGDAFKKVFLTIPYIFFQVDELSKKQKEFFNQILTSALRAKNLGISDDLIEAISRDLTAADRKIFGLDEGGEETVIGYLKSEEFKRGLDTFLPNLTKEAGDIFPEIADPYDMIVEQNLDEKLASKPTPGEFTKSYFKALLKAPAAGGQSLEMTPQLAAYNAYAPRGLELDSLKSVFEHFKTEFQTKKSRDAYVDIVLTYFSDDPTVVSALAVYKEAKIAEEQKFNADLEAARSTADLDSEIKMLKRQKQGFSDEESKIKSQLDQLNSNTRVAQWTKQATIKRGMGLPMALPKETPESIPEARFFIENDEENKEKYSAQEEEMKRAVAELEQVLKSFKERKAPIDAQLAALAENRKELIKRREEETKRFSDHFRELFYAQIDALRFDIGKRIEDALSTGDINKIALYFRKNELVGKLLIDLGHLDSIADDSDAITARKEEMKRAVINQLTPPMSDPTIEFEKRLESIRTSVLSTDEVFKDPAMQWHMETIRSVEHDTSLFLKIKKRILSNSPDFSKNVPIPVYLEFLKNLDALFEHHTDQLQSLSQYQDFIGQYFREDFERVYQDLQRPIPSEALLKKANAKTLGLLTGTILLIQDEGGEGGEDIAFEYDDEDRPTDEKSPEQLMLDAVRSDVSFDQLLALSIKAAHNQTLQEIPLRAFYQKLLSEKDQVKKKVLDFAMPDHMLNKYPFLVEIYKSIPKENNPFMPFSSTTLDVDAYFDKTTNVLQKLIKTDLLKDGDTLKIKSSLAPRYLSSEDVSLLTTHLQTFDIKSLDNLIAKLSSIIKSTETKKKYTDKVSKLKRDIVDKIFEGFNPGKDEIERLQLQIEGITDDDDNAAARRSQLNLTLAGLNQKSTEAKERISQGFYQRFFDAWSTSDIKSFETSLFSFIFDINKWLKNLLTLSPIDFSITGYTGKTINIENILNPKPVEAETSDTGSVGEAPKAVGKLTMPNFASGSSGQLEDIGNSGDRKSKKLDQQRVLPEQVFTHKMMAASELEEVDIAFFKQQLLWQQRSILGRLTTSGMEKNNPIYKQLEKMMKVNPPAPPSSDPKPKPKPAVDADGLDLNEGLNEEFEMDNSDGDSEDEGDEDEI